MRTILSIAAATLAVVTAARADIFQWEYTNPADPSWGKQQSTTLCPDGAGVDAVPGAYLDNRNLTMAYLIGADLAGAYGSFANLTDADLSQANLTGAHFSFATLTNADFTGAEISGASFGRSYDPSYGGGITSAQLYSTASYAAHDLSGIDLMYNYLNYPSGANFSGLNLTGANLYSAGLTGANFTNADLRDANFGGADLRNADLTGADIRGARFNVTVNTSRRPSGGLTLAQLYSTASYQTYDLAGINLGGNYHNLEGGNFAHQNLTNSSFGPMCLQETFCFWSYWSGSMQRLIGADFTGADARGAEYLEYLDDWAFATTTNLIRPDGHISGVDLDAGTLLVVRDYDGDPNRYDYDEWGQRVPTNPIPPIPITVDQHLTMAPGGTLRMVFEADAWNSTISFAPGIPVTLGGTLELTFSDDVNLASQLGRTFELFNWTGVTPTGAFAVSSPYAWDLSNLYTTGQVTLTAVPEPASLVPFLLVAGDWFAARRTRWYAGGHTRAHATRFCRVPGRGFAVCRVATPRRSSITRFFLSLPPLLLVSPSPAHADIFQWEYVNPADPSQGKQQSTTLCPDGAGAYAVPGADLSNRNLTMAYLIGADLGPYYFYNGSGSVNANLASADFTAADLRGVAFTAANLTDVNFTDANIQAAIFYIYGADDWGRPGTGISLAQLYSTASYKERDLSGIIVPQHNFAAANFVGQNLTGANLGGADLTGADFTNAEVRGASLDGITLAQLYSTASYVAHDLSGIGLRGNDLSGANLSGQNLTGANLAYDNLTGANFTNTNLTGVDLDDDNLTDADFTNANLTDANLSYANLTGADFTNAEIRGARFVKRYDGTGAGITPTQLYSTASYAAHDLSGITLANNDLSGANFAGFNLTGANLAYDNLTGADFTNANLTGVDLVGANLTDADFTNANLTGVDLLVANLTDADFTGSDVRGAQFYDSLSGTGITLAQLYSTASYQAHDLSGIIVHGANLAGANFAGQNLTNAYFSGATLTGADFTAADLRGAYRAGAAIDDNLIRPDGHISGLELDSGELLRVRDYDGRPEYGYPSIPITVEQHLTMGPGGTLRMVFEADAWDSTISFAPGIPVTLGGTLELTFAADVNLASQLGRTFDLFDWTGVAPTGAFAISSPYAWDLSRLYTTGQVTLTAIPEPTSFALAIMGAFGVTDDRRRRIA